MVVEKVLSVAQTATFNSELNSLKNALHSILGCSVCSWIATVALILIVAGTGFFLSIYKKVIRTGEELVYKMNSEIRYLTTIEQQEIKEEFVNLKNQVNDNVKMYTIYKWIWIALCVITGIMLFVSITLSAKYNTMHLAVNNLEILLKK